MKQQIKILETHKADVNNTSAQMTPSQSKNKSYEQNPITPNSDTTTKLNDREDVSDIKSQIEQPDESKTPEQQIQELKRRIKRDEANRK